MYYYCLDELLVKTYIRQLIYKEHYSQQIFKKAIIYKINIINQSYLF